MTKKKIAIISSIAAVIVAVAVVLGLYFGGVIGNYVHRTLNDFSGFSDFSSKDVKSIDVNFFNYEEGEEIDCTIIDGNDIASISSLFKNARYELQDYSGYPGQSSYNVTFNFNDGGSSFINTLCVKVGGRYYYCESYDELSSAIDSAIEGIDWTITKY